MRIVDPSAWVFDGTGLSTGDRLSRVVGPEYDRVFPGTPTPSSVEILSHSPLRCRGLCHGSRQVAQRLLRARFDRVAVRDEDAPQ